MANIVKYPRYFPVGMSSVTN